MKGFWSGGDIRDALTRERLWPLPSAPDYEEDAGVRPPLSRVLEYDVPGGQSPHVLIAKALKRLKGAP